jgi:hypothetical protein
MRIHGVVRTAELQEHPPGSDRVEMVLRVQGVGPQQPRTLVIPFAMLVDDPSLDPDAVAGRGFEAEVSLDDEDRWVIGQINFASRVLRPKG